MNTEVIAGHSGSGLKKSVLSEKELKAQARHNPWDRMSKEARDQFHKTMSGARPVRWTLNVEEAGQIDDDGYVLMWVNAPLEGTPDAAPKKRADGKVDGRSKGLRKCGKCGGTGHNARTCSGRQSKVRIETALHARLTGSQAPSQEPVQSPQDAAQGSDSPVMGSGSSNLDLTGMEPSRSPVRGSKKGTRQCGKCGEYGHNARTCAKGATPGGKNTRKRGSVRFSRMPTRGGPGKGGPGSRGGKTGRLNTCGRCGGKGHNARTCTR